MDERAEQVALRLSVRLRSQLAKLRDVRASAASMTIQALDQGERDTLAGYDVIETRSADSHAAVTLTDFGRDVIVACAQRVEKQSNDFTKLLLNPEEMAEQWSVDLSLIMEWIRDEKIMFIRFEPFKPGGEPTYKLSWHSFGNQVDTHFGITDEWIAGMAAEKLENQRLGVEVETVQERFASDESRAQAPRRAPDACWLVGVVPASAAGLALDALIEAFPSARAAAERGGNTPLGHLEAALLSLQADVRMVGNPVPTAMRVGSDSNHIHRTVLGHVARYVVADPGPPTLSL